MRRTMSAFLAFCMLFSIFTFTASVSATVSSNVQLNYTDLEINLSNTYETPLYATVGSYTEPSANGKVTWSSSNPAVATVDSSGRVKPVSAGSTVITATHVSFPSEPVTCNVTVYSTTSNTFFYVSPNGSDVAAGTESAPFKTIQKARDTIRALPVIPNGGITVILEDGKYFAPETITFTPEDSGTRDNPIIYKARNAGKAIVTGEVSITGWSKAADSGEMSSLAQGKVYVADVGTGWRFHDLYVNGERQQVSRSYNSSEWRSWPLFKGRAPISYDPVKGTKVVFGNGELDGLNGKQDVEVALLPVIYWNSIPVLKSIDPATKTGYLQSKVPSNFWTDHFEYGYYNILNTLKYLDQPGEWSVDSQAGKVYYWPKDANSIDTDQIVAPKPYELLKLQGDKVEQNFANLVQYLTFDGISFEYTDRLPENEFPDDWIIRNAENPDAAIYLDGTKNIKIINSSVKHSGSYGITVNHYGQLNEIIHNQLSDLGSGGVQFMGYGVGTTDVNKNNTVMFNSVFKMGVGPYQHSPAISVFGSGKNTLAYNYIAGAPYAAISIVGTDENSVSATNPNKRAAYDLFGETKNQYGIRFNELDQLPASEKDGVNGEYFSIARLAQKYQHSERNVAEYNILEDYSQSMDDGGALYSWYSGLGNVYAYNILKEQLQGARQWVFWLYMDDRAIGYTLENNLTSGNFNATIDKSFAPYSNRRINNVYAAYPAVPAGYDAQRQKIMNDVQRMVGGYALPGSETPTIIQPVDGDTKAPMPTTIHWNTVHNASAYKLEIATDANFINIVKTMDTASSIATINDLNFNTKYYSRVTTREYLAPAQTSSVTTFTTDVQQPPTVVPQGFTVVNSFGAVLTKWTPIANTAVNVYRKGENDPSYVKIAGNIAGDGYLDSNVVEKKSYAYKIAAVNTNGEGPLSDPITYSTLAQEIMFSDTFDTSISDLWTDLNGIPAKNTPANAVVTNGQWIPAGSWKEYYVGVGNSQWKDYAVEADITFSGLQAGAEAYSGFGLVTRANKSGTKSQFYQFIVRTNDTKYEFVKNNAGNWTTFISVNNASKPAANTLFKMRFENEGNIVRIYLNGVLIRETTDSSFASGGIGFGYGKDNIKIDNVRVLKLKDYAVTLNQSPNGSISSTATVGKVTAGQNVEFTFAPANGYKVKKAFVNGNEVGLANGKYLAANVQVDLNVTAEFEAANDLVSITTPLAITDVANGTAKTAAALALPSSVNLVTTNGSINAAVAWDLDAASYDPAQKASQTFTVNGTVALPAGVANPNSVPLTTSINVTVTAGQGVQLTGPASVLSGQPISLTYSLVNVTASVYAQDLTISFDPGQLRFVSAESIVNGFSVVGESDSNGIVRLIAAASGPNGAVTGTMDVLKLNFQAQQMNQSVNSAVNVTRAVVADVHGVETPLSSFSDYSVQVTTVQVVDKTALNVEIAAAQTMVDTAKISSTRWGYYPQSAVDALKAALSSARTVANDVNATQAQANQAVIDLDTALATFAGAVNTTANVGDLAVLAGNYGATSIRSDWTSLQMYDLNNDNKLDIIDLAAMARKILGQ